MTLTENLPILGLENEFPDELFVIHHASSNRYGCYCHDGVHGLACFSSNQKAIDFTGYINLANMQIVEVTFDEAREIAKDRPPPVVSMMLLDNLEKPMIHYVK